MHFQQDKMKEQIISVKDLYSLNPQVEKVEQSKLAELALLAKKYYALEKKYNAEPFYSRQEYYIISSNWLKRWKVYVGFTEINGAVPPNKYFGCGRLPTANEDIVQSIKAGTFDFDEPLNHLNIKLKPGLQQKKDYEYITKEMFYCFRDCQDYEMIRIPRLVVMNNENKKIVQLQYLKISMIPLCRQLMKDIEQERSTKFMEVAFQFSKFANIKDFAQQIFRYIKKIVESKKKIVQISTSFTAKLWLLKESTEKNIFFNTLKQGCKANSTFEYKLFIDGELLQYEKKLNEYDINQATIFVIELREQSQKNWTFFNGKQSMEGTCNHCRINKELTHLCSCKYAAYCSSMCKTKDKFSHKSRCPNDAQSDQEQPTLTLNSNSKMGKVGLRNLGNTCFMNSGLQCISHISQLIQYFIQNKYVDQINKINPLGTKGQLSTCYAKMAQNIWFGTQQSYSPAQLKRAIGKFQPMFSGYNQHDSSELINYLLDGLHQDLNRVKQKPYVQTKNYDGRPDKIVAKQAWQNFLKRNQSIIVDLMYGQYKSIVDCPACKQESVQFDPFLMLSLPLVNNNKKNIEIIFIKDHLEQIILNISYTPSDKQTIKNVFQIVIQKMNLAKDTKLISYAASYSICEFIPERTQIEACRKQHSFRKIYVRQLLKGEDPQNDLKVQLSHVVHSSNYSYSKKKTVSNNKLYFFNKDLTYKQVHYKLYSYYKKLYQVANYELNIININPTERPFKILCIPQYRYKTCQYCKKKQCEGCQLVYSEQKFMSGIKTPKYIEMQFYWIKNAQEIRQAMEKDDDQKKSSSTKVGIKIQQCFDLFQEPEVLTQENAWYCPKCKQFVLAKKQMKIYKAPKILILALKRFKRKQYFSEKYNIFVDYPVEGLDLSKYVLNPQLPHHSLDQTDGHDQKPLYDLIGVSNHTGSTGGGHYTAYCKDINEQKWYEFDDSHVSSVKNTDQVVSQAGYVLFYRRRE